MSVALTAAQATLKAREGGPCAELRQFGAGHDVRAAAPSAFNRELQAEADEITCRADMLRGHFAAHKRAGTGGEQSDSPSGDDLP